MLLERKILSQQMLLVSSQFLHLELAQSSRWQLTMLLALNESGARNKKIQEGLKEE
jgi:hypothetical protein